MFRRACLVAALVVLALYPGSAQPARQRPAALDRSQPYVSGELLVGFHDGIGAGDIDGVVRQHGLSPLENLDSRRGLRRVAFPVAPGRDIADQTQAAIVALMRSPFVRFAEPNYVLHTNQLPNDPRFADLYGLQNIGQAGGTYDADIDAPEAWTSATGSSSVVVFVIDTGVDYGHEDLAANIWTNGAEAGGLAGVDDDGNGYVDDVHGINAITNSGDPMDDMGHGTHVAGTIGAQGNNGTGVVGVVWSVSIGACKFLDNAGYGTTADAVKCFQYVNALKARGVGVAVTNNSWGGGGFSQSLADVMGAGLEPILHVCAAGNDNSNNDALPSYPGSYELPNIIAVAATDHNDLYASFSNYGAGSVDLAAPGVAIVSTVPTAGAPCCSDATGYKALNGTSMATPFVAGAAALLKSAEPNLSAASLKSRLLGGTDSIAGIGSNSLKQTRTQGRLNIGVSLEMGSDPAPPEPVTLTAPSAGLTSLTLAWQATGDDGIVGTASSYDIGTRRHRWTIAHGPVLRPSSEKLRRNRQERPKGPS